MAQYLLLEFDSDKSCETLRNKLKAADPEGKRFRIIGIFQKPTKWCECSEMNLNSADHEGRTYDSYKIRIGAKYGWRVHYPGCQRPIKTCMPFSPRNLLDNQLGPDDYPQNKLAKISTWTGYPLSIPSHLLDL